MKQEILDTINEFISEEKGQVVTKDSKFIDANLDSLGATLVIVELDSRYPCLLKNIPEDMDIFAYLNISDLTIKDLVKKCRSSITSSSQAQN